MPMEDVYKLLREIAEGKKSMKNFYGTIISKLNEVEGEFTDLKEKNKYLEGILDEVSEAYLERVNDFKQDLLAGESASNIEAILYTDSIKDYMRVSEHKFSEEQKKKWEERLNLIEGFFNELVSFYDLKTLLNEN
jgi:hypothetical protein